MSEDLSLKQANQFLLFGILTTSVLYFAKVVLIPLTFAAFFAMLFSSPSNKMEKAGIKRIFSALISTFILVVVVCGIAWMVVLQCKALSNEFPVIEKKYQSSAASIHEFLTDRFGISAVKQKEIIEQQIKSMGEKFGQVLQYVLSGIVGLLASSVLILIFTFLFLLQREKYEAFFMQAVKHKTPEDAKKAIEKISKVSQKYLTGRALSILFFTILFTLGFLIVGLKNAFLLAFIAALLTIVPYVGSIVGGLFPFFVALATEDSIATAIGALVVIGIIQGIDNYFIEPYIIGGEVNISGFFTILILFIGGIIWGVAGMILFLPMLGIVKIICDTLPQLNPYGYLIGDQEQEKQSTRLLNKIKKLFSKK